MGFRARPSPFAGRIVAAWDTPQNNADKKHETSSTSEDCQSDSSKSGCIEVFEKFRSYTFTPLATNHKPRHVNS